MNRKRRYRIISAIMLCVFLLLLPVFSFATGTKKVDPKEGFPYNDYENFRYHAEGHPEIASGWNGSDYVLAYKVTVRDATKALPKILSIDDYIITFKNLPRPEDPDNDITYVLRDEEVKSEERVVYYQTSFSLNTNTVTGDLEQSWKNLVDYEKRIHEKSSSLSTIKEGSLGGHKALYRESEPGSSINYNNYHKAIYYQDGAIMV